MVSTASTVINLRTPPAQRELIDRAARLQGKSRTDFMLEASREKAEQVLLDQTVFTANAKQYKAFVEVVPQAWYPPAETRVNGVANWSATGAGAEREMVVASPS